MANVEEILSAIDVGLTQYLPVISGLQDKYQDENGRYWQGLFTHAAPPTDTNTAAPDMLDASPTDQDSSWDDIAAGTVPAEMLSRVRIDTYKSTQGHGYVVVVEKIINGKTYEKRHNVGPESSRSRDWTELSDE